MPNKEPLLWPAQTDVPPLAADAVHVWSTSLLASDHDMRRLHESLAADEQQRAARMRLGHVRDRFVVSRGRQREILAAYLSLPARALRFEYGEVGKPRLVHSAGGANLYFNLSNSHKIAVLAVSRDRELGIDVEYVDRKSDADAIAKRFFSDRENRALAATPAHERKTAFYHCWTRKEAVLKALGVGLTFPLDRVEVPVTADPSPGVLALDDQLGPPDRWTLVHLAPAEGYVASLAFEAGPARVHAFAWGT